MTRPSNQHPSPDQILESCIEKIREEFADRIPIVRAYPVRDFYPILEESGMHIRYVVETAAAEDSVDPDTYGELEDRTRDLLLYSGYFRDRKDVISVRVISEERLRTLPGIEYPDRWWPEKG